MLCITLIISYISHISICVTNNARDNELNPGIQVSTEMTLSTLHTACVILTILCYTLAHWLFGLKYFVVSLLLYYRGALPPRLELFKRILNVVIYVLALVSAIGFGLFRRWQDNFRIENKDAPSYIELGITLT